MNEERVIQTDEQRVREIVRDLLTEERKDRLASNQSTIDVLVDHEARIAALESLSSLPAPRGDEVCPECGHGVDDHTSDMLGDGSHCLRLHCLCTRTRASLEQAGMGSAEAARSGDVSVLNARQPVEAAQLAPQGVEVGKGTEASRQAAPIPAPSAPSSVVPGSDADKLGLYLYETYHDSSFQKTLGFDWNTLARDVLEWIASHTEQGVAPSAPVDPTTTPERRPGRTKLVYNKATRTIDTVRTDTGSVDPTTTKGTLDKAILQAVIDEKPKEFERLLDIKRVRALAALAEEIVPSIRGEVAIGTSSSVGFFAAWLKRFEDAGGAPAPEKTTSEAPEFVGNGWSPFDKAVEDLYLAARETRDAIAGGWADPLGRSGLSDVLAAFSKRVKEMRERPAPPLVASVPSATVGAPSVERCRQLFIDTVLDSAGLHGFTPSPHMLKAIDALREFLLSRPAETGPLPTSKIRDAINAASAASAGLEIVFSVEDENAAWTQLGALCDVRQPRSAVLDRDAVLEEAARVCDASNRECVKMARSVDSERGRGMWSSRANEAACLAGGIRMLKSNPARAHGDAKEGT